MITEVIFFVLVIVMIAQSWACSRILKHNNKVMELTAETIQLHGERIDNAVKHMRLIASKDVDAIIDELESE